MVRYNTVVSRFRYDKKKEMPDKRIIQELNTVQNSPMALFRITFVVEIAQKTCLLSLLINVLLFELL